jgi:hypothetical protein
MTQAPQSRPSDARSTSQFSNHESSNIREAEVDFTQVCDSVCTSLKKYSAQHPSVVASIVFLAGFYVGWKTKPW